MLYIGRLKLKNKMILAPLAGITALPFRVLAKEAGCALVCSEMISANGLVHNSLKTKQMLKSCSKEKPLSVQIFGSEPDIMAEAAAMVESSGADILDINFGCSVKKVVKTGAGAALLKDPDRAEQVIKAVRKAITIPLTVKLRAGWDRSDLQAFRIAKIAEDNGADALTLHPRTAVQGFGGRADRSLIGEIKKQATVPVIGNGDITTPQDGLAMLEETSCDAVMIGRAAVGRPWIFSQLLDLMEKKTPSSVSFQHRLTTMIRFVELSIEHYGEKTACYKMRSQLGWFVKGMPYGSAFRDSLKNLSSGKEAVEKVTTYWNRLKYSVLSTNHSLSQQT